MRVLMQPKQDIVRILISWMKSSIIYIVFSVFFLSSCSNPAIPTPETSEIISETPTPPLSTVPSAIATDTPQPTPTDLPPTETLLPPTNTPTSTPIPQPESYLLTPADAPEFSQYFVTIANKPVGFFSYWSWFIESGSSLMNRIEIGPELPGPESLTSNNPGLVEVEALTIGDQSKVFTNQPTNDQVTVVFYKNNVLVRILMAGNATTIDRAMELAERVADKLPDEPVNPLPLTFPNDLDEEFYTKYLGDIRIGQLDNLGNFTPLEFVNSTEVRLVVEITALQALPSYQIAIFDPASNQYIIKNIYQSGAINQEGTVFSFMQVIGGLTPGNYEFHFAIDGILVKVIPFESRG